MERSVAIHHSKPAAMFGVSIVEQVERFVLGFARHFTGQPHECVVVVVGVAVAGDVGSAARGELLGRVLADHLEEPVPRVAVRLVALDE